MNCSNNEVDSFPRDEMDADDEDDHDDESDDNTEEEEGEEFPELVDEEGPEIEFYDDDDLGNDFISIGDEFDVC